VSVWDFFIMIGIYKIISPNKKIYIGQSKSIEKRFKSYKKLRCKSQVKLYRSFLKYGVENHKFEIVCECGVSELNIYERYYQDMYSVIGRDGLNCQLINTDYQNGAVCDETKEKMSIQRKGRKHTEKTKRLIAYNNSIRIVTDETKNKISNTLKGVKLSRERVEKSNLTRSKVILDIMTGVFYFGLKEASKHNNVKLQPLGCMLRGVIKNTSNLIYT